MSLRYHRHTFIVFVGLAAFWPAIAEPVQVVHGFGVDSMRAPECWPDDHGFSRKAGNLLRQRLHVAKGLASADLKPVGSQGNLQQPATSTFVPIQVKTFSTNVKSAIRWM
jgi:hypothetical protein